MDVHGTASPVGFGVLTEDRLREMRCVRGRKLMKRSILILTMLFVALSQSFLPKSARAQAPSALQYEVLYISGKIIYPRLITRKGLGSFMPLQASSASNNKVIV